MESVFHWSFGSKFERGRQWYTIAAAIVITGIIASFLTGAFLLGIVLIIFAGVYLLYDVNTREEIVVDIGSEGIALDGQIYAYHRIRSFAILRIDNEPRLLRLKLQSKAIGDFDLFLAPNIEVESLRTYLAQTLSEETNVELTMMERLLLGLRL